MTDVMDTLLTFDDVPDAHSTTQTRVINVRLGANRLLVGIVCWKLHGYAFVPNEGTYYNARGLAELELFIRALMDQWARDHERQPKDVQTRRVKRRQLNRRVRSQP